ncbi:MAG: sugar isomerase domain-containing protein [bacterium]|nr:sugar isomerase domain-containing protein [bacterium]
MLKERYYQEIRNIIDLIIETQSDIIRFASSLIVESLVNGGAIYLYDHGGHSLQYEGIGRAGGPMFLQPFTFNLSLNIPIHPLRVPKESSEIYEIADIILKKSNLKVGDVIIIGSVSGRNPLPIELAIRARELGIKTVGITSISYSKAFSSRHYSGKKLFEVVDVAIDNCGVVGDAILEVKELPVKICPTSGISGIFILWLLIADVIELLLERGIKPHVYKSINFDDAKEFNERELAEYKKTGI